MSINENMKVFFLDKHYAPYNRGYPVKLLRLEELTGQVKDYVDGLMHSQELPTKRSKKKTTLDSMLFDESGKLNP